MVIHGVEHPTIQTPPMVEVIHGVEHPTNQTPPMVEVIHGVQHPTVFLIYIYAIFHYITIVYFDENFTFISIYNQQNHE